LPDPFATPVAALFGAIIVLTALSVYGAQIDRIIHDGGKVRGDLELPELLISLVIAGYFAAVTISTMLVPADQTQKASIDVVLPSALFFAIMTAGIAAFIRYRGLRLRQTFGLDRLPIRSVLGWAAGLTAAAFPIALGANALTAVALKERAEPQALVDLFNQIVRDHDYGAISKILVAAVVIQPICEEFLFRGLFYGTWKRYLGPLSAGFLSCLLFAAFHTNLASLAGLFILAVCLNIAYERTGSLLVPISMHAIFNLTNLLLMWWMQTHFSPAP